MKRGTYYALGGAAVAAIGVFWWRRRASAKVVLDPNESKIVDPIVIELDLTASWIERTAASESDLAKLQQDIFNIAEEVAAELAQACPGAPPVYGVPSVNLLATSTGFLVTVKMSANWGSDASGEMRPQVANCIQKLVLSKDADIADRLQSFRAYRA